METYTNIQKAAILLLSLGPDASVNVMKHLDEKEIELVTREIANLRRVTSDVKEKIIMEFHDLAVASHVVSYGGVSAAQEFLRRSFGEDKASDFLERLKKEENNAIVPFQFVQKVEPIQIFNLLQYENAQTIALVLSYIDSEKAADILSSFAPERQLEIARRIAMMDTASPEFIQQVEQVLNEKLSMTSSQQHDVQNGVDSIVNILNSVDRGTEKNILDKLQDSDPELADEIKQRMFVFDDIANLDNRSIQRILMEVPNQDLPLALAMANSEVKDAIFRNISKRRQEALEEEMALNEQVPIKEVEEAQTRVVNTVRKLEVEGAIIISRNGEMNRGIQTG
ncbi:flagellar motor switch protein FliG [Bacillus sp. B15-48]|uniref:flagellar motor switch protein FliG n=1 Tax=Bacillus sp. B15-48 TaxID=1548601 RepID=UPI00193FE18E|nr:flagellar motor switch protein FliG [Bacillus sp. B15-48]MBM4764138.1 flagellar motor switch protein FliG [Bacillus sp. B15-48]